MYMFDVQMCQRANVTCLFVKRDGQRAPSRPKACTFLFTYSLPVDTVYRIIKDDNLVSLSLDVHCWTRT
jgi:hypothetical protein